VFCYLFQLMAAMQVVRVWSPLQNLEGPKYENSVFALYYTGEIFPEYYTATGTLLPVESFRSELSVSYTVHSMYRAAVNDMYTPTLYAYVLPGTSTWYLNWTYAIHSLYIYAYQQGYFIVRYQVLEYCTLYCTRVPKNTIHTTVQNCLLY
jgi:hypothetical protein